MLGEGGPIGGAVAATRAGDPPMLETTEAHGLQEGDRVRISSASGSMLCYVRPAQSGNIFSVYKDADMKQPAAVNGIVAGDRVERLYATDWAIVAGINFYPAFTHLKGPRYDAAQFKKWAVSRGFVPDDQVMTVQSPDTCPAGLSDAKPTMEELTNAFTTLVSNARNRKYHYLGRRLYLFFSGHGIVATSGAAPDYREAALLMANADADRLGFHIGVRAHAEWFRALGIFDEVVVFADCCRDVEDNVPPTPPYALPSAWKAQRKEGRQFYAFPTMLGSKSWERGFGNPEKVRGIFSYVVVEALNNQKLYTDEGTLPASALEQHLYATVPDLNGKQNPIIDYARNDKSPEIILAKWYQRARQKVNVHFKPSIPEARAQIFRGVGSGTPLATAPADHDWSIDLDAGFLYKVTIPDSGRSKLFEVMGNDEVQDVEV